LRFCLNCTIKFEMRLLQFLKINKRMFRHILLFLNFFLSRSEGQALIASLPRSGTHLTFGMLNVCFSMQEGFSGELAVSDNEYASFVTGEQPFDERSFSYGVGAPKIWHSHMPYSEILPVRKKFCKTIVLVRDPINYIKSVLLHDSHSYNLDIFKENEISLKTFLELDKRFQWVSRYSKFLSSWRKRKNINKSNSNFPVAIIDLEFLKLNLRDFLRFINYFFNLNFTEKQMDRAVDRVSIERINSLSSTKSIRISKQKVNIATPVLDYVRSNCEEEYIKIKDFLDHNQVRK